MAFATLVAAAGLAWRTVTPEVASHAQAGIAAQQAGRMADAIKEFRTVTELAPSLPAAYVNLGAALLATRAYAESIPALRKALELNNDLPGAHRMLGYALLAQGYAAEAIPHLEQTQTFDALGVAQLKTGKLPEAIQSLETALVQRPNDPDLLYYLGRASGLLSKNSFDLLEAAQPDSARAHQALGENYAALRKTVEAEREFRAALKNRPDAPGVHLELGRLYTTAADWPKATEEFRAEAQLQPGDGEVAYNLGQALLQDGKTKEAIAELDRSNKLQPDMPETLYLLGKALSSTGNSAKAETYWKRVITIEPESNLSAQSHFGLAALYRKAGKTKEAEEQMKQFRNLQGRK